MSRSDRVPRFCARTAALFAICALTALAFTTLVVEAKPSIEAAWGRDVVSVDGSAEDWQDAVTYLDGPELFVGARNDEEYLYLCVYSEDPQTGQQAIGRGLKLQLEPKGRAPLTIGFPVGLSAEGGPPTRMERPDREEMRKRAEESLDSFTLLEPGGEFEQRVASDNGLGIELRAGLDEGRFVYEARIPLSMSEVHPFAIGADTGDLIAVTLQAPKMERDSAGPGGGGMRPGGGGGGMRPGGGGRPPGGGGGGMRPGGMDGGRPEMAEPIKLRAKIRLAAPPGENDADP